MKKETAYKKPSIKESQTISIMKNSLPIPEKRFKDFLPFNINNDSMGDTAKILVEHGDDERLKTEIYNPVELTIIKGAEKYLTANKLVKSASLLNDVVEQYSSFMFSFRRHSRGEYIEAVKAYALKMIAEQQKDTLAQRLTSNEGSR